MEKARHSKLAALAEEMSQQSITIEANANDEGHLYGSVGAAEIVNALKRQNITMHPEQVRLKGPLKELGLYTVKIHLGQEIEGELKVWVVPAVGDEEPARRARKTTRKPKDDGRAERAHRSPSFVTRIRPLNKDTMAMATLRRTDAGRPAAQAQFRNPRSLAAAESRSRTGRAGEPADRSAACATTLR